MSLHAECRCCDGKTEPVGSTLVLGKYPVAYQRCTNCGFVQTETPFWLEESYSNPMTSYDLGGISRPTLNSLLTKALLTVFFDENKPALDFGGGYGVFTRWMRDIGYNFWHYDAHAPNLFAQGFAIDMAATAQHFELATAFEVFEHLPQPVQTLGQILEVADSVFFSTDIVPEPTPSFEDWRYFGPEHGQHVAFYSKDSLRVLAARFGARFVTAPNGYHMITRKKISDRLFRWTLRPAVRTAINLLHRRPTLLTTDFYSAMARAKAVTAAVEASHRTDDLKSTRP